MRFFKKIQDWILKSERIQKRVLRLIQDLTDHGASKEPKNPLCEWTSQEYRDTSGTFIELWALNLKVRQLNVRQTIEKTAEKVKKGLRFSQLLIN